MRLAFMGTPDFAVPSLAELIASGHDIVAVYSQPPRPKGRGQKLTPSPVHAFAETMGLPVFTPESMKAREVVETFSDSRYRLGLADVQPDFLGRAYEYLLREFAELLRALGVGRGVEHAVLDVVLRRAVARRCRRFMGHFGQPLWRRPPLPHRRCGAMAPHRGRRAGARVLRT